MRFWLIATMTISIGISFAESASTTDNTVRVQESQNVVVVE